MALGLMELLQNQELEQSLLLQQQVLLLQQQLLDVLEQKLLLLLQQQEEEQLLLPLELGLGQGLERKIGDETWAECQ
jgi:hypothetical protein